MKMEIFLGVAVGVLIYLASVGVNILPLLFSGILLFALFHLRDRGISGALIVTGDNKKKTSVVSFNDIGGQNAAKNELLEALEFMNNIDKVKHLGIRPLKGVLLTGPPGTGKTLLAKAAANYTDSAFVSMSGSDFVEMYAGVGAARVRNLFKEAHNKARREGKKSAVIFIDEIDVLGGKRGAHQSHMEYDQTLNALLVEMDGMSVDDEIRVLVMAATNRPDVLDEALLRPGRFDRQVKVDLPDKEGRLAILQLHTRNKPLADDVNLEEIAKETFGFSGAHLESLTNEAAILAMRQNKDRISHCHFKEAIDKVMLGEKMDRRPSKEEMKRIAIHELGHALLSEWVSSGSVSTITVTSRGNALGFVRYAPENDPYLYTKEDLLGKIDIAVAGAVAEEIILGNRSTGADNDFGKAVLYAEQIVYSGMSSLGIISRDIIPAETLHQTVTALIDTEVAKVRKVVKKNRAVFATFADKLMFEERLSGEEFRLYLATGGLAEKASA